MPAKVQLGKSIKPESIGNRIRLARKLLNMDQSELGERVGVGASHICLIESGDRIPSVDVLFQLGKVLKVSLDYLVTGKSSGAVPKIPEI